jgi:hypothetical protein
MTGASQESHLSFATRVFSGLVHALLLISVLTACSRVHHAGKVVAAIDIEQIVQRVSHSDSSLEQSSDSCTLITVEKEIGFELCFAEDGKVQGGVPNPSQVSFSPSQRYAIAIGVPLGGSPEVYRLDLVARNIERLTDNQELEYDPCVDDEGRFAWASWDRLGGMRDRRKVVFSGREVASGPDVVKCLATNGRLLAWCHQVFLHSKGERESIVVMDIDGGEKHEIAIDGIVESMAFVSAERLVIEMFSPGEGFGIHVLNVRSGVLSSVFPASPDRGGDYISSVCYGSGFDVVRVTGGDRETALWNAYRHISREYPLNSLAYGNNLCGRQSWVASKRLLGMVRLYDVTGDTRLRLLIRGAVRGLMATRSGPLPHDTGQQGSSSFWPTRVYSLDRQTDLELTVNVCTILWPLLASVKTGVIEKGESEEILAVAREYIEKCERFYDADRKGYRFEKDIAFWADGVPLPFNMQNTLGMTCALLFDQTGEEFYRKRALALLGAFSDEWEVDEMIFRWRYWPALYYKGWLTGDDVSTNTPSSDALADDLYEDLSHAGINMQFVRMCDELLDLDEAWGGHV